MHVQLQSVCVHTEKWRGVVSVSRLKSGERSLLCCQKVEVAPVLLLLTIRLRQTWLARRSNVGKAASI